MNEEVKDEALEEDDDDVQLTPELKGKWAIQGFWNKGLTFGREERELKPRIHIWASEIGKDPYMRYLSMTAVKPDFDFPVRVLRKFAVGNLLERVMGAVLVIAGILKHDNERYEVPKTDTTLMVSVKPDFIAGGKIDWEKSKKQMDEHMFFEFMPDFKGTAKGMIEFLQKKHPDGLHDLLYEIKSVNSMLFWAKKHYLKDAYPHHIMQTYTGMKATGVKEGRILYISKDDYTVAEFPIYLEDKGLEKLWQDDVKLMTKYIRQAQRGTEIYSKKWEEYQKEKDSKNDLDLSEKDSKKDFDLLDKEYEVQEGDTKETYISRNIQKYAPPKPESLVYDKRQKIRFQHKKVKYVINGAYVENWEVKWSNYLPTITGCKNTDEWLGLVKAEKKVKNDDIKERFKIKNNLTK